MAGLDTQMQQYIFRSKYSRWREKDNRREAWDEAIDRYVDYMKNRMDQKGITLDMDEWLSIRNSILDLDVVPSMRAFMTAGPAMDTSDISSYNCAYTVMESTEAFDEILYILCHGTGVGFSVERQYTEKLPEVSRFNSKSVEQIYVGDSREGWSEALREAYRAFYGGKDVELDISDVRPAGARLKTFGGYASGPQVFVELIDFSREIFKKAEGRKLKPIEVADLVCKIAYVIVSGGVRRSALICLSDLEDKEMAEFKSGEWWIDNPQRALANISAVYNSKPDLSTFLEEWKNLYDSKSGERGIFNREAARKQMEKTERRKDDCNTGTNPCQPAFARIITPEGIRNFGDIKIGDEIWSETGWTRIVNKWSTGIKPVYKYKTTSGSFVGTGNHRILSNGEKIEARLADSIDILPGENLEVAIDPQDVIDGLMIGDGSTHLTSKTKTYLTIGKDDQDCFQSEISGHLIEPHAVKYKNAWKVDSGIQVEELPKTWDRSIPDRFFFGDRSKVAGFLRGIYSANGSICGGRVTLKSTSIRVIEQVQEMLSSIGIKSYYTMNKEKAVKHHNGEYVGKQSYDLNINTDKKIFLEKIGFIQEYKNDKLEQVCEGYVPKRPKTNYEIVEVEYLGDYEVFDITVDNLPHTYWTGGVNVSNCGEILLRPHQFCNLSEVVVREDDTLESLKKKIKVATLIGTIQSTLTNFPRLRSEWKENCEEERLLGVSLTGVYSNKELYNGNGRWLHQMKKQAIETNKHYADLFGINQSTSVTCNKPSGTVSQLAQVSSGIHPWHSEYFVRSFRGNKVEPMTQFLEDQGIPCEDDLANSQAKVFYFPVKAPSSAKTREQVSALERLNVWRTFKNRWTEHNPSVTINVDGHEWLEVAEYVYRNFDEICGVAFLPYDGGSYKQAPFQEITEEEYYELASKIPTINWDDLKYYEIEDTTDNAKELACVGNKCEI